MTFTITVPKRTISDRNEFTFASFSAKLCLEGEEWPCFIVSRRFSLDLDINGGDYDPQWTRFGWEEAGGEIIPSNCCLTAEKTTTIEKLSIQIRVEGNGKYKNIIDSCLVTILIEVLFPIAPALFLPQFGPFALHHLNLFKNIPTAIPIEAINNTFCRQHRKELLKNIGFR